MRTSALLLAAAAVIPAASQATVHVVDGTWAYISNGTLNSAVTSIFIQNGSWTMNSLSIDGLTVVTSSGYTPNAADFNVSIKEHFSGNLIATATGTSAGSLVPHGNGYRSHFFVTFDNLTGWDVTAGTYDILVGLNNGAPISISSITTYGPGSSPGTNGWSASGTPAIDIYATGSGGAVPEPSTYGIVLGGLVLAGAVVRRRRAK